MDESTTIFVEHDAKDIFVFNTAILDWTIFVHVMRRYSVIFYIKILLF